MLNVAEVRALAEAMPERFRAMILLTTFASLRFGEAAACSGPTSTSTTPHGAGAALVGRGTRWRPGGRTAQVGRRAPDRLGAAGGHGRREGTPRRLRRPRAVRARVHRAEGWRHPARQLPEDDRLDQDRRQPGAGRAAPPRPQAHREHARRHERRQHSGPDGRARVTTRCGRRSSTSTPRPRPTLASRPAWRRRMPVTDTKPAVDDDGPGDKDDGGADELVPEG